MRVGWGADAVVSEGRGLLGGGDHHRRCAQLLRHLAQPARRQCPRVACPDADRHLARGGDCGLDEVRPLAVQQAVGLAEHADDGAAVAAGVAHEAYALVERHQVDGLVLGERRCHDLQRGRTWLSQSVGWGAGWRGVHVGFRLTGQTPVKLGMVGLAVLRSVGVTGTGAWPASLYQLSIGFFKPSLPP